MLGVAVFNSIVQIVIDVAWTGLVFWGGIKYGRRFPKPLLRNWFKKDPPTYGRKPQ